VITKWAQKRLRDLQGGKQGAAAPEAKSAETVVAYPLRPIGTLNSVFSQRNGTPRQPLLVPLARARLKLRFATACHTYACMSRSFARRHLHWHALCPSHDALFYRAMPFDCSGAYLARHTVVVGGGFEQSCDVCIVLAYV